MSVNLILAIRDARGLSASEKSILYSLAARCKSRVMKCYPAIPTLAGDAGMHERSAQRVLEELSKKGWITVIRKKSRNSNKNSNSDYILHPPPASTRQARVDSENIVSIINPTLDGGAMSPPGGVMPPSGGAMPPEVSIEVTKEVTKTSLSTGREPPSREHESVDAANLIRWFASIGVTSVEMQALKRDNLTGRGISGQSIEIHTAHTHSIAGQDIFIRPIRGIDHPVIMLDDLDAEIINDISTRWRSAIVETSAENHQAWIATSRPLTEAQRKIVQKMLVETFDCDVGSVSGEHWGRAPGYANRKKDRHNFVARLISTSEKGKLLDVDAVLDQAQEMLHKPKAAPAQANHALHKRPSFSRTGASGDESADEFGYCINALKAGVPPDVVEANLLASATPRRGKDAPRYVKRTISAALHMIGRGDR